MTPATAPPERRDDARMLVVQGDGGASRDRAIDDLLELLDPGDVLVVNDAATLPASIRARTQAGEGLELRLLGPTDTGTWRAVLFGAGDWRAATEDRPAPPILELGQDLDLGQDLEPDLALGATIIARSSISSRLVELVFDRSGSALWHALYALGKPVQYSYLERELPLYSVQTVYSARPWAAEMPSAGRPLTWSLLSRLRRRGVVLASLTHAAGLSATGDPALDRALPLPERYDIPEATVRAIDQARAVERRVIAVGTTVVRALEGNARDHGGHLVAGTGMTDLVIDQHLRPAIVHGLLTGVHAPSESHFRLLRAFARESSLLQAWSDSALLGYRYHEFGDTWLLLS